MNNQNDKKLNIAIDGPAGSGKSTISRLVALKLDYKYIDTGAMYRSVALIAKRKGIPWNDEQQLYKLALNLNFDFIKTEHGQNIIVNDEDLSNLIRTPEISKGSSDISKYASVRLVMVEKQKEFAKKGGVVMEGRDIGTVVMPQAEVKIFLTASEIERANRRFNELKEKDSSLILEKVLEEMKKRDIQDSTRDVAPLKKADDAVEIDTTFLSINEVVEKIIALSMVIC